jgi:chloramphenicol-sensitive protein RarD
MTNETIQRTNSIKGIYYALSAFVLWGFLPLYWKLLNEFSAAQILANRIIWSLFLLQRSFIKEIRWMKSRWYCEAQENFYW